MNIADLIFIVLLLAALQFGARIGIVRQAGITAGLVLGVFSAALLQSAFATLIEVSRSEIAFWLLALLSVLVIGLFFRIGWAIGSALHKKAESFKFVGFADTLGGCAMAGATVVAVLLFWSSLLVKGPNTLVASQLKDSFVVNGMRQAFPQLPEVVVYAANLMDPHSMPQIFAEAEPVFTGVSVLPDNVFVESVSAKALSAVVRVSGTGCGGQVTGTGFAAAKNVVITNAHVVAGLSAVSVGDQSGTHVAQTVVFDPKLDIAILRVANMAATPLPLKAERLTNGSSAVTFGYAGGALGTHPASVLEKLNATGYDIYNQSTITRSVYVLSDAIEHGDSGGPMVDEDGQVVGVVFGKSSNIANVGYALTADQVVPKLAAVTVDSQPVSTGQCGARS